MDTHYRSPEDKNKIIYGEWVIFQHANRGDILATIQDISPVTADTSYEYKDCYTLKGNVLKAVFKKGFSVKVQYTNPNTRVGHVAKVRNHQIRPMTEEENRDLEAYFRGEYALIINSKLLKEAVKERLKTGASSEANSIFL